MEASGLSERRAGHAVMAEVLRLQESRPPRRRMARVFGADPLAREARSWFWGALGEQRVARVLAGLGPGWHVLHSIPVGKRGADIDHVVIGPGGVFTLNTKHHRGANVWVAGRTLMVNGHRVPYLRNSAHEAARASALLTRAAGYPVEVRAVVVLVAPRKVTTRSRAEGAVVLTDERLRRWLARQPRTQSDDDAARLSALAAEPATWGASDLAPDPAQTQASFDDLRAEVVRARARRLGWLLAGCAGVVVAALDSLPHGLFR
ncbi:nuclease-related domain-containing protein [Sinomonas susongensis]|uniref:nuclease-related domain-containing protein n=1 Tax=Sinomonas susongensis TaxID=1324851 RepID=UPI0011088D54|nr:nuclease-related domain-containing protein [Sinomonas susongensis]